MTIVFFCILLIIVFLLFFEFVKKRRIAFYQAIKKQWGQKPNKKRDYDKAALYFYNKASENNGDSIIDENTAADLNLEKLFSEMDCTNSKIGEQVLYDILRTPKSTTNELFKFNQLIHSVCKEENERINIQFQLAGLSKREDYYIINFLFFNFPKFPSWFWYTYLIQIFLVLSVIGGFFYSIIFFIPLILFPINFLIHYKTKTRFEFFYSGLSRIAVLYSKIKKLIKLQVPCNEGILKSVHNCKKIISMFWIFKKDNFFGDAFVQAANMVIELVKIITLIEVQQTYKICTVFEKYTDDFLRLYYFFGEIDAAISVGSFRKSLPHYCIPEFVEQQKTLNFEKVYHPLIENCIVNNFYCTNDKSIFINGSNMSGKTTFIRTIGINVLMARTIFTSTATKASLSFFNVHSSINIEDNLEGGISYYFEELLRLKKLVSLVEQSNDSHLFLIDEILKGTNIYDRTRIATSILKYLNSNCKNLTMVTSHDIDLADKLKNDFDFYYFKEEVSENNLDFDYTIHAGTSNQRNAVKLLKILDFPRSIINNLKELLGDVYTNAKS